MKKARGMWLIKGRRENEEHIDSVEPYKTLTDEMFQWEIFDC
jgi:hypothetical protein